MIAGAFTARTVISAVAESIHICKTVSGLIF